MNRRTEALRMAAGLTLLDDAVNVAICGELAPDAEEHLEALDFADVPVEQLAIDTTAGMAALASRIATADAVYLI
jgi:hypothetical protein